MTNKQQQFNLCLKFPSRRHRLNLCSEHLIKPSSASNIAIIYFTSLELLPVPISSPRKEKKKSPLFEADDRLLYFEIHPAIGSIANSSAFLLQRDDPHPPRSPSQRVLPRPPPLPLRRRRGGWLLLLLLLRRRHPGILVCRLLREPIRQPALGGSDLISVLISALELPDREP